MGQRYPEHDPYGLPWLYDGTSRLLDTSNTPFMPALERTVDNRDVDFGRRPRRARVSRGVAIGIE